ncbi:MULTISPECIES: hypothetical protein [unclassified Bacillus (in: firmicutes)]|uniref:hypothetical protein n=1 Tax=unclassified Bacillus (in: firmicutes) TaxID=185979 RepID=UPI00227FE518|nr:hypothetical protein [Bacillus sp. N12A5]MCY8718818.1 hypothetical protein [Bacillus sp. S10C12M]
MEKQIISWITKYQHTGDEDVLRNVREACWPIVEAVLQGMAADEEQASDLRVKGIERFPFIISKYQADVQLPVETFLRNTYRFYFHQVMRESR